MIKKKVMYNIDFINIAEPREKEVGLETYFKYNSCHKIFSKQYTYTLINSLKHKKNIKISLKANTKGMQKIVKTHNAKTS